MKANATRFTSKIAAGVLLLPVLSLPTARAADPVQWDDLPKKIGHAKLRSDEREDRRYGVVTKDGQTFEGYQLLLKPDSISLAFPAAAIPRAQVAEIRIHRDARWLDAFFGPAGTILDACSQDGPFIVLLAVPVALGVTVGASPITLSIEGVKRLRPDKVLKVAPQSGGQKATPLLAPETKPAD